MTARTKNNDSNKNITGSSLTYNILTPGLGAKLGLKGTICISGDVVPQGSSSNREGMLPESHKMASFN